MNQAEWAERIKRDQERVKRLQARIAAGEDEATAARAEGFATRNDIEARNAKVLAAYLARKG